ncbi:DUF948 domain-containing protein [Streptomyces sp. NPDC051940]|uniref:DUF948 domain-containing protein n=1 Tax=Streptomyces sp. NPDC051940 TaxID=3155675 RepID=UPI0034286D88
MRPERTQTAPETWRDGDGTAPDVAPDSGTYDEVPPDTEASGRWSRRTRELAAGAAIGLLLVGLTVFFFTTEVCGQQVTPDGRVVQVCRRMRGEDPPVIAIGLAVLVLLGVFFSEISGFGITLRRRVEQAEKTATRAIRRVERIGRTAERLDETTSDLQEGTTDLRHHVDRLQGAEPDGVPQDPVDQLAHEYNRIRWEMPSGEERTRAMTRIADQMKSELVRRPDFDFRTHFADPDRGRRLAAFAYLCLHPHPESVPRLAEAATAEDKPFGQYWALKALGQQLRHDPSALDPASADRLQGFLRTMPYRTDRAARIRHILRQYGHRLDLYGDT